jgi:Holliday junction DNA helicase RuvA
MIASVSGEVLDARLDCLVISVGGVGLAVMCSPDTIASARIGEKVSLQTSLIVREDSLTLFGFTSADSRELFELIQSVSGFGPRLAFTILSSMSADELRNAISQEDVVRLTKTPGVGSKGASRLILELKDRVGQTKTQGSDGYADWQGQVEQALTGLGWSAKDAHAAVIQVVANYEGHNNSVPELLKLALQELGK